MKDFMEDSIDFLFGAFFIVFAGIALITLMFALIAMVMALVTETKTHSEIVSIYRYCGSDKVMLLKDGTYMSHDSRLPISDPNKVCGGN